jgi:membrane-bound lytic murein transglycosylase D
MGVRMGKAHSKALARDRALSGRDWRLAVLGGGCTVLGSACLLLAACSSNPNRPRTQAPPPASETTIVPVAPAPVEPTQVEPVALPLGSPWSRLRQRFSLSACDYNPAATQLARQFSADSAGFSASLSQSLPFLLVVLDQVEKRDMPGEFAFLPYIESNYTPIVSSGDRAAGIWQLMPDTAREAGLPITREYDGRLDIVASTNTALDLLERYQEEFGDWHVANMAYNAGEYGLKDLLGDDTRERTAVEISRLRVPPHTHKHLAKLLAVSCIVADPERFHVELPEPQADDELATLDLPAAADFALVARIAGIDVASLHRLNPAYLRGHMPETGPYRLLLPASHREAVAAALDKVPQSIWHDWHEIVLQQDESLEVLATAHGLDAAAMIAANAIANDAPLSVGTRVLVPGRGESGHSVALAKVERVALTASTHIVSTGDTLWSIAHRARVRLDDLLRWNGLHDDPTLHVGQRLRLQAPEGGGTAVAAGAPL